MDDDAERPAGADGDGGLDAEVAFGEALADGIRVVLGGLAERPDEIVLVVAEGIRILTALSGDWPIMFAPTAFDIAHVRIAAIDLADVAPQGSPEAGRQTAAFYLLARHALTRHWWIGEDSLADIPEPYRAWHGHRLRDIREAPKRLAYDEFHRTAGAPAVRAQVERDVREARKLRVRLSLASQRLEDFGGALTELANRYWILGAGGKAREIEALSGIFALSETLQDALRYRLPGPGKDGAPALLIASDARGRFEQLVVNTPGPAELWAQRYNTAPVLVETFVETPRYTGAVYRASGWIHVGTTQGRGRYDRQKQFDKPKKDVWLRPLRKDWKRTLNR